VRRLASDGLEAWKQVVERGYEGYVARDEASVYEGRATRRWLKVKQKGWTVEQDRSSRRAVGGHLREPPMSASSIRAAEELVQLRATFRRAHAPSPRRSDMLQCRSCPVSCRLDLARGQYRKKLAGLRASREVYLRESKVSLRAVLSRHETGRATRGVWRRHSISGSFRWPKDSAVAEGGHFRVRWDTRERTRDRNTRGTLAGGHTWRLT